MHSQATTGKYHMMHCQEGPNNILNDIYIPCQEGPHNIYIVFIFPAKRNPINFWTYDVFHYSHQLCVSICHHVCFVLYFERSNFLPKLVWVGRGGGMSIGGYFRIVSALTSHNLLARGPNNLIKHQTFWFISDNLFAQPDGGKEMVKYIWILIFLFSGLSNSPFWCFLPCSVTRLM